MKAADKIKIRKFRKLLESEFGNIFEATYQESREGNHPHYKDKNYWNEQSSNSLQRINAKHGKPREKKIVFVDSHLRVHT